MLVVVYEVDNLERTPDNKLRLLAIDSTKHLESATNDIGTIDFFEVRRIEDL